MNRKKVTLTFLILSILCILAPSMPGYCSEKPTCAVLLFHPDTASSNTYQSQILSGKFAILLDRLDMFDVIDYKETAEILKNKNLADAEQTCTDLGCALKIGNQLDADFVIYGIIGNVGSLFSLDTTLVNVAGGNETQHAVYDFEGTPDEFLKKAAAENVKQLFGLSEIPGGDIVPEPVVPSPAAEKAAAPAEVLANQPEQPTKEPKKLRFGLRIGIAASNDGIELGGGFEVQFSKLSCQLLANDEGFAGGLSFYLHPEGNSPFLSIAGSYYDTDRNNEIGRIYGLLLGYRIALDNYVQKDVAQHINIRIGAGAGYVNWDARPTNKDATSDEEIIPICELTLGYMF